MGDRALVLFKDNDCFSPVTYLHWSGYLVGAFLSEAAPRMRAGDATYASARFVGTCHEHLDGGLSLGLFNSPEDGRPHSHGDAGVFVVDVHTGEVETYGGYGFGSETPELPLQFGKF